MSCHPYAIQVMNLFICLFLTCVHILKLINIIVSLPRFSSFVDVLDFCLVDISYPVDNFDLFICSGYFVIVLN